MSTLSICAFCDLGEHGRCRGCACMHPAACDWARMIGDLHAARLLTDPEAFNWLRSAAGLRVDEALMLRLADKERRYAEEWLTHDEWRARWGQ